MAPFGAENLPIFVSVTGVDGPETAEGDATGNEVGLPLGDDWDGVVDPSGSAGVSADGRGPRLGDTGGTDEGLELAQPASRMRLSTSEARMRDVRRDLMDTGYDALSRRT